MTRTIPFVPDVVDGGAVIVVVSVVVGKVVVLTVVVGAVVVGSVVIGSVVVGSGVVASVVVSVAGSVAGVQTSTGTYSIKFSGYVVS